MRGGYLIGEPGWVADFHYHDDAAEAFCFIEGECEMRVGDETRVVRAGETVYTSPGEGHSFHNKSGKRVVMFLIVAPNHEPTHSFPQPDGTVKRDNATPPEGDELWIGKGD
jgi:mannose-6-phosphate isomerase-like protein (cupin superfamily)